MTTVIKGDRVQFYTEGVCELRRNKNAGYEIWALASPKFPVRLSYNDDDNEDSLNFFSLKINTGIRWKVERGEFDNLGQPIYASIKNSLSNCNFIHVFEEIIDETMEENWEIKITLPSGVEEFSITENFKICEFVLQGNNINYNLIEEYPIVTTGPFRTRKFDDGAAPKDTRKIELYYEKCNNESLLQLTRKRCRLPTGHYTVSKRFKSPNQKEPCFDLLPTFHWDEQIIYLHESCNLQTPPALRPSNYDAVPDQMTKEQYLKMKARYMETNNVVEIDSTNNVIIKHEAEEN